MYIQVLGLAQRESWQQIRAKPGEHGTVRSMLAYRHAFHAGNHADVLKHATLVAVLRHMNQKDKAWRLVDTHAGAGSYGLNAPQAQKLAEHYMGIGALWKAKALPPLLADYVAQVRQANAEHEQGAHGTPGAAGALAVYPGSPRLTRQLMRPHDQLRLYELHPTDHALLSHAFEGDDQVDVHKADGFAGIKAQLPPSSRRGVLLIDPSYEIKTDYQQVVVACREALTRFAEGVVLVWHPELSLREATQLAARLKAVANAQAKKGWLHAKLTVAPPNAQGFGMLGSAMFVINPPHTLRSAMAVALPVLADKLGQFDGAKWQLDVSHGL